MENLKETNITLRNNLFSSECVFKCESAAVPGRYYLVIDCRLKHDQSLNAFLGKIITIVLSLNDCL